MDSTSSVIQQRIIFSSINPSEEVKSNCKNKAAFGKLKENLRRRRKMKMNAFRTSDNLERK